MFYKNLKEAVEHMEMLAVHETSYDEWHPIQEYLLKQDAEYIRSLAKNAYDSVQFFWPNISDDAKDEVVFIINDMVEILEENGGMEHVREWFAGFEAFKKSLQENQEIH